MVIGVATPMVAYVVVDGKTVMSGSRMTIIAGVFSICAILCYIVCFKLTRERVEVPASSQKVSASAIFKSIFTNRALLGIIVAAIFVLLSQLTVMSLAGYVYPNVYGSAAAQSTASLLGTVIMLIVCAPFASKLAAKFGKKELAVASSICSALVWLVCLIWRPASVWGFVACYILANVGMGFFNTIIWAMITDVIDDAEVRSASARTAPSTRSTPSPASWVRPSLPVWSVPCWGSSATPKRLRLTPLSPAASSTWPASPHHWLCVHRSGAGLPLPAE